MSAQSGRDMLLKLDETGAGSFVTVGGIRTRQISFNAQSVDVTDSLSSGRWRELLNGGGLKTASINAVVFSKMLAPMPKFASCSSRAKSEPGN